MSAVRNLDEIANAAFATLANMTLLDEGWVENDEEEDLNGDDLYFSPDDCLCYWGNRPESDCDTCILCNRDVRDWIDYCERRGYLIDEEWIDIDKAIERLVEYLDADFGEENSLFDYEGYDDED